MKKKIILFAVAATAVIGTIIGGTMAAYQATGSTTKTVSTSAVDIDLKFTGDGMIGDGGSLSYDSKALKDGSITEEVKVVNTGSRDVYVRVSVNKAWYDAEGSKIFNVGDKSIDSANIGIVQANESDWLLQDDLKDSNEERIYLYYTKPLTANGETSSFMSAITILKNTDANTNEYSNLSAKLDFDAEAVQTTAAEDAMLAAWGVKATMNGTTIASIVNQ